MDGYIQLGDLTNQIEALNKIEKFINQQKPRLQNLFFFPTTSWHKIRSLWLLNLFL